MEREKVRRESMDLAPEDQRKAADFIDEPFIGLWSEREDLKDSTEWVRETREKRDRGEMSHPGRVTGFST